VGGGAGGGAGGGSGDSATSPPSASEVAVSTVSGALNNNSKSGVAFRLSGAKSSPFDRALALLSPIGTAYAATWTCSGEALDPTFKGPGTYEWTPPSCKVTWDDGKSGTSSWSDAFQLVYGSSCDAKNPFMETQAAGCELTRTSTADGDTRTVTGPDGNTYAIDHDTNGAGTGWDTSVTPSPTDAGVIVTCGSDGCSSSRTLVVSGSHITGTVDVDKVTARIWDHTVSTSAAGLTVKGEGAERTVSGTVTVQHNLLKYTSTTTFDDVTYGSPGCCFPTGGTVTTVYTEGQPGRTEKLVFSGVCGESTLTDAAGNTGSLVLVHCL
jgi:hypothetical protein